MKKKNYSIILCGGLFLASCMSNNDKCLQKLFDEVGVEKSQIHNATHLVTILGNGCKGCIHKALSEIHNSTDTIYIIACKSKKTFNLIANKNIDDYSNVYLDTKSILVELDMAKNTPRVYLLNNGKYVSHSFYGNESPSEEANTTITFNTNEIDLGKISRTEKAKIIKRPVPLNDTHPLWSKHPNDCTDEEYKTFYRKVFQDYKEPLFWIHLNMDYPFNLKGILYFPKINTEYDSIEGMIKLYNNQVFIADNIKEVIPEFLMLLKGVIDCPDLPLNVSRSALQNDGFVKKISDYITKKVADKLSGMCKTDKESYEKYWDDISPFIKFGCLKDEKFCDKMNDYILFKNLDDKYLTLPECLKVEEPAAENADGTTDADTENNGAADTDTSAGTDTPEEEDKDTRKPVYYVTDVQQQGQYINMFKEQGMDAVILDHNIDTSFITQLERRNEKIKFVRIDADLTESLKEDIPEEELKEAKDSLTETFRKALNNENLKVSVEKLKNAEIASVITLSEEGRRMQDMMKMYGMAGMDASMFGGDQTLVLNAKHALVQYILNNKESEHVNLFCEQLYDLAVLSNHPLPTDAMGKFVARSNQIMMLLAK